MVLGSAQYKRQEDTEEGDINSTNAEDANFAQALCIDNSATAGDGGQTGLVVVYLNLLFRYTQYLFNIRG